MILEYLPGGELFSYLRISKCFASPIVKFYSAEIISALEYLHSKYIVSTPIFKISLNWTSSIKNYKF